VVDRCWPVLKEPPQGSVSVASKAAVRCVSTSSAACLSRSGLRPARITSAPSARARRAVSSPMPALRPIGRQSVLLVLVRAGWKP